MAASRMWLMSLTAGAVGGVLVGKLREGPHLMLYLGPGQIVLAETRGAVQATLLAARVQAHYDELCAHRLRFGHPALREHYAGGILAGPALYQTLREENDDREAALATVDCILAAAAQQSVLAS